MRALEAWTLIALGYAAVRVGWMLACVGLPHDVPLALAQRIVDVLKRDYQP